MVSMILYNIFIPVAFYSEHSDRCLCAVCWITHRLFILFSSFFYVFLHIFHRRESPYVVCCALIFLKLPSASQMKQPKYEEKKSMHTHTHYSTNCLLLKSLEVPLYLSCKKKSSLQDFPRRKSFWMVQFSFL